MWMLNSPLVSTRFGFNNPHCGWSCDFIIQVLSPLVYNPSVVPSPVSGHGLRHIPQDLQQVQAQVCRHAGSHGCHAWLLTHGCSRMGVQSIHDCSRMGVTHGTNCFVKLGSPYPLSMPQHDLVTRARAVCQRAALRIVRHHP